MDTKGKSKVIVEDSNVYINLDDDNIDNANDVDDKDIDLLTSIKSSFKIKPPTVITIDDDDSNDDKDNVSFSETTTRPVENNPNPGALAQPFICDMCTNSKPKYQSINIKGCIHFFCCDCVEDYVSSKLRDGVTEISCPVTDCFGTLDPEYCKDFLSSMVYRRWGRELCESAIVAEQKFYCPFKDCGIWLLNDGGMNLIMAECPYCYRRFCTVCKTAWHEGLLCGQKQMSAGMNPGF